ncbi:MAG TPA: PQQ-dependent sugar dehydrogenase, partial [Planctomycetota bacterium]|nr:PQQ-dependent sugar dehydrogenase [Planctomycetota bacterium]
MTARFSTFIPILVAGLLSPFAAWAQTVPANTSQSTYKGGMSEITAMAWAKDGTDDLLFVSQKSGDLRVIKNGNLQSASVFTLAVLTNNECGLDNVIVDPSYSSNTFIYVFACVNSGGNKHKIYRYTISNGATVTSSGQMQIGPDTPCGNENHNGGGMAIGADGFLYMGTGNLGLSGPHGNDGNTDEWTSLASKIIRIDRINNTAPSSNPWFSDPVHTDPVMKWVFAKGFRNPFGLRCRPGTSDLWLTEVGDNWEQVFLVTAGSTQGWSTENNTTDNSKLKPVLAYPTNGGTFGGCLTRGAFYNGAMFPAGTYMGNFFFVDYNSGKVVRNVMNGSNNGFTSSADFVTGNSSLTDINVGPDGALYYSDHGGTIYRLQYNSGQSLVVSTGSISFNEGGSGTFQVHLSQAPASNVTVTVMRTSADTDVSVAAGSTSLTFTPTNFGTNQTVTINGASNPDMINHLGTIQVSSSGLTSQNISVTVVNTNTVNGAPTATITGPTNGSTVSGTNADFFGQGTDPQGNGTLSKAEFYVDGVLKYTDPYVAAVGHFHYGSAHTQWNTTALSNGTHTLRLTVYDTGGLSGSSQVSVTVDNSVASKGLRGDYYSGTTLTNWVMSRIDPTVNFDWGTGSPDTSVPVDGFSVRWTGQVTPAFSQAYTFYTNTDDGARLWVNGVLLHDHWVNQGPTEWSGMINLTAGTPASIVFEYFENTGGAMAQLSWSSASQAKGGIPTSSMSAQVITGPPAGAGGGAPSGGGGG